MMNSKAVMNSEKYSDEEKEIMDIHEKLEKLPTFEQNSHGVSVCISHVPKSFSSTKPEAFIPQLVGLGPYHHFRELIMTDELKLAVVKRLLKVNYLNNKAIFHQRLQNFIPEIQAFYHADVYFTYEYHKLSYILMVDGLFLLALLHNGAILNGPSSYYILTGKQHGMPLVNAAGVELNVDDILRDVFMIENQIPTYVLRQISSMEIQQVDRDMGSTMLDFCEALCPLVHSETLSKDPEAHDHLLDLMYHLISPEIETETESNLELDPEPDPDPDPVLPEPISDIMRWSFAIITLLSVTLACLFVFSVALIWELIFSFFRSLFRAVKWAFGPMPNFFHMLNHFIDRILDSLSREETKFPSGISIRQTIGQIKENIRRLFRLLLQKHWVKGACPSATELQKSGIQLQPSEGGISSIKFQKDKKKHQFYLPCIRLNAISEVIIRNLMAYESLTKSDNCLVFACYVELMSSLIHTVEDVKLLVHEKIIQTQLSDDAVAQLFNELGKLVRPTKVPKLEKETKKLQVEFDIWYTPKLTPFLRIIMCIICVGIPLGAVAVSQNLYCAFYPTAKFCKLLTLGDYRRSNYFIGYM